MENDTLRLILNDGFTDCERVLAQMKLTYGQVITMLENYKILCEVREDEWTYLEEMSRFISRHMGEMTDENRKTIAKAMTELWETGNHRASDIARRTMGVE